MESDRWAKIAEIYQAAPDRSADERAAFLADACGEHGELRREVESLLAQDVSRDGPIERVVADAASLRPLPEMIGRYRIVRLIGEGGIDVPPCIRSADSRGPRVSVSSKASPRQPESSAGFLTPSSNSFVDVENSAEPGAPTQASRWPNPKIRCGNGVRPSAVLAFICAVDM